ncbi:MAG TPA: hypothetical protein VFY93_08440 [Planctomycetota bacterium]|nr:hypothetical protein [Planctomycetota bacterium]
MKTLCLFVAFGLLSSFAVAGDGEGCPGCKPAGAKPTTLAAARQQIADIPKADEKLPAEQLKEVKAAREFLMQTSFGKAMGPSFESCGRLMLAAAIQPGTSAESAALMKDMAATYCSVAKIFGGCADCKECCPDGECPECKGATPESCAAKAKESLDASQKLLTKAMEEMPKATPEFMQKVQAAADTLEKKSPCWPAIMSATKALNEAYASLAKMGIPAAKDVSARDQLVKSAFQLHTSLTACHGGEGQCEENEGCEDAEEPAEAPEKSS